MEKNIYYFGSPLARYRVDLSVVQGLNSLADQLIQNRDKESPLNMAPRLASAVNCEIRIPQFMIEDIITSLKVYISNYHTEFNEQKWRLPALSSTDVIESEPKFMFEAMWVVSQYETEWNLVHSHSGDISGVLYLKVPANMAQGIETSDKRAKHAGAIAFIEGTKNKYRTAVKTFLPQVGDLYLFPSDLTHTVYPFFGNEERRSLSFNVFAQS